MFKARHEMIALGALLGVAIVALVIFELAQTGQLHFWESEWSLNAVAPRFSAGAFSKSAR
jgi:hypothetical protein